MKILLASSEAEPFIKTGGLADVVGALLKEYLNMEKDAYSILPLYRTIKQEQSELKDTGITIAVPVGSKRIQGRIFAGQFSTYFIACDEFYNRTELYGTPDGDYPDNASRFIFFSRGVIEACKALKLKPDIIHCNDWQTGLIPLYLKTLYSADKFFKNTATVFTIHNLGYQGLFPSSQMPLTGLSWELFKPNRLEFYGQVNFLKAGIISADILNTVSHTYAKEILNQEFGFGLDGVLRERIRDLYSVLNGIDPEAWDPSKDAFIPHHYSSDDLSGKVACKSKLMSSLFGQVYDESERAPLIGMVGRLSAQKGLNLVIQSVGELVSFGVKLAILGKGENMYHKTLTKMARKYKGAVSVTIGFEEARARKIYAGSDFFLMPSRYEPCGLGQLIAMRYGCVPIARKTGGLSDTIHDYEPLALRGTGFLFSDYTPPAMQDAVKRALCVYTDSEKMHTMIRNCMMMDFTWMNSAKKYIELYKVAAKRKKLRKGIPYGFVT
jgi:starch synthase